MTTYIVEVDSTFRDINKYPTQTDFVVSFQTNTSSDYFVQGLPLSYSQTGSNTYYDNFFNLTSIDPDFQNANLQINGGSLQSLQRVNDEYFLSGIIDATGPSGFSIGYSTGTFFSLSLSPNHVSPFVSKLTQQFDGSFSFNWISYITGEFNPSGPYGSSPSLNASYFTSSSINQPTPQGNVYWYFDTNYYQFDVQVYTTGATGTTLYNITNPSIYQNSVNNYVVAISSEGYYHFVNNRPWGYHILHSNWNMFSTNTNGRLNLTLDPAENIYVNAQIGDSYYPHIYAVTGPLLASNAMTFIPQCSSIVSLTGITGATGGNQKYFLTSVGGYFSTYRRFNITTSAISSYLSFKIGSDFYDFGYNNIASFPLVTLYFDYNKFIQIANNVFIVQSISPSVPSPIHFLTYSPYDGTCSIVASTPVTTFLNIFFGTVVIGNLIIVSARTMSADNRVYMYEFNSATNALTQRASLVVENSTLNGAATVFLCQCNIHPTTANQVVIVTQTCTLNGDVANILVLTYDTSTYTLTQTGTLSGFVNAICGTFVTIRNRLYYIIGWNIQNIIRIIDVTNPSAPVYVSEITAFSYMQIFTFEKTDPITGVTNVYLNISNDASIDNLIYNINNPANPYPIGNGYGNRLLNPDYVRNLLAGPVGGNLIYDPESQYIYGINPQFDSSGNLITSYGGYYRSQSINNEVVLYSSHYNQNLSITYSLGGTYSKISTLSFMDEALSFFASSSNIVILQSKNVIQQTLYYTLTYATPFVGTILDLDTIYVQDSGLIYLAVTDSANTYLYVSDTTFTSWTLLTTILPATVLASNRQMKLVQFSNNANAITPKLYLVTVDLNGTVRKWSIDQSIFTVSLELTVTPFTSIPTYLARSINKIYYNTSNTYVIYILVTNNANNGRLVGTFNITEPSDFSLLVPLNTLALVNDNPAQNFTIQQLASGESIIFFPSSVYVGVGYGSIINNSLSTLNYDFALNGGDVNGNFGITSWLDPITQKSYVAWNIGNNAVSANDRIAFGDISDTTSVVIAAPNISVTGNVKQMDRYQIGSRTILVNLLSNNTVYFYDVSNVNFAGTNQSNTVTTTTYTNIQSNGSALIHGISNQGVPRWLNIIGTLSDDNLGFNANISSLVRNNLFDLYAIGSWSRRADFFQSYNGTGASTILNSYPCNEFISTNNNINGFVAKLRVDTGEWTWAEPILGNKDYYMQEIGYSNVYNSLALDAYFNSENQFIYPPQTSVVNPTGLYNFMGFGQPQLLLNNTSNNSSMILSMTEQGYLNWHVLLNTLVPQTNIQARGLYIDETNPSDVRIYISGLSNTTNLIGTDGLEENIQALYPQINPLTQNYVFGYTFNAASGSYLSSQYVSISEGSILTNYGVRAFSDINQVFYLNNHYPTTTNNRSNFYNKDSTLGDSFSTTVFQNRSILATYDVNSIFQDQNTAFYSQLYIYGYTGPTGSLTGSLANYSAFILGDPLDVLLNKNFSIRDSRYDFETGTLIVTLNQIIETNHLIRRFDNINGITGSSNYYSSNISPSPLSSVITYNNISQTGNSIVIENVYGGPLDTSKEYFFVFPQQTGGSGTYTDIVPIVSLTYDSASEAYTASVSNINDLRVPSPTGPLYGPYIYLTEKNYSAYYSLQWYPGARTFSQTYLVGLYDLIIPNRPVRNSRYPGVRFLNDYPYIYLVIYNSNDEDQFNPAVVNSVYDNNVAVPRFALFQIPTTNFSPLGDGNYFSATSAATPKIIFSPGYYYLHFKLTDDRGNVILFDNTPYKPTDSIFTGGVVPDSLLNITARMAFKKQ